jgi:pre-mRNA-splicing helicase BRR2
MIFVQQSCCRLMRALFEIALKRGWSSLAQKLLTFCKIVERRTWLSQSPLRQFSAIPELIIRKLEKNSDISWERFYDLKPQDLGELVKLPKMGKSLYKYVHAFPKLELSAEFLPITRSLLQINLTLSPDFQYDESIHDSSQLFWIIVEDVDGVKILHYESFSLQMSRATEEHLVSFYVTLLDPLPPQYFIKLISDRWLHAETILPVSFRHLLLPNKFPPCMDLLDLQPLPISTLRNKALEGAMRDGKYFSGVQTQVFSTLFEGSENALICVPDRQDRLTCALLSFFRHFSQPKAGKCLYLTPSEVSYLIYLLHFSLKC